MSTNLNTCRSPNYLSVAFICAVTVGTDYSLLKPFVSANHMLLESCEESWCTKSILGTDPALGDSRRYETSLEKRPVISFNQYIAW